ncbi:SEC-C domain-containing protein, partial [Patescibacteria group bacterium]|nr:SEC-C domain-containing protein [Patescibacteria group bacterium]
IDEARTPLIISAPAEESTDRYYQFAKLVRNLQENSDYNIDEKMRACTLTEEGIEKIEKLLGVDNIYQTHGINTVHHLEEALRAETLFKRDRDYVVKGEEVIIVDEFTGRLMQGRRYSGGLHQAIEAKEGVKIQRESITMATVTFQNYFRMYEKLAGMTGTAATESEEFSKIYNLDVTIVPTNKPMIRKDLNDSIYKNEKGKLQAIVREIKQRNEKGQPLLIGTISIEKNEILSELLNREGIKHELLNAKNHEREAEILAQAGKLGAVTVATNMAGRGVDIILGGNPPDPVKAEKVKELGGLHIIGTERHEARRIDNQLRGRSGRQGDPGSSQFFISMEDDLMRIFGSERMKSLMTTLGVPDDMPIENKMISKSIESAQRKVEGNNFDLRKHLVEYDDILNKQREVIYKKRREILKVAENQKTSAEEKTTGTKKMVLEMIEKEIERIINFHVNASDQQEKNLKEIAENINTIFTLTNDESARIIEEVKKDSLKGIKYVQDLLKEKYDLMEEKINKLQQSESQEQPIRQLEKFLLLRTTDTLWVEHLEAIEHLRTGIGLRGYGQRDPLIEYKKESFSLFQQLLDIIQDQVTHAIFKMGMAAQASFSPQQKAQPTQEIKAGLNQFAASRKALPQDTEGKQISSKVRDTSGKKIGRNDPCPCGSGRKYKKCHGK